MNHKINLLAYMIALNINNGAATWDEVIKNIKRLTPLEAAYLALEIATYLPDSAEADMRVEILKELREPESETKTKAIGA